MSDFNSAGTGESGRTEYGAPYGDGSATSPNPLRASVSDANAVGYTDARVSDSVPVAGNSAVPTAGPVASVPPYPAPDYRTGPYVPAYRVPPRAMAPVPPAYSGPVAPYGPMAPVGYTGYPVAPVAGYGQPVPMYGQPNATVVVNNGGMHPRSVGISTGEHIMHGVLTFFTAGLWLPIWIVRAVTAKRKFHY